MSPQFRYDDCNGFGLHVGGLRKNRRRGHPRVPRISQLSSGLGLLRHHRRRIQRLKQYGGDLSRCIQHRDTQENTDNDKRKRPQPAWPFHIKIVILINQMNARQLALDRFGSWFMVKTEWVERSGHGMYCNVTASKSTLVPVLDSLQA